MPARRTAVRRLVAATAALVVALAPTACSTTDSWVQAHAADGWSAQYGDAANRSFTPVDGAQALRPDWLRSVKGGLGAQVALGSGRYLAANGQTAAGCSLVVWEFDNHARQRWCTRLWQGGGLSGPLFDGFDNLYVGQPGAMLSFPPTQWIRWRQPVIGLPLTPRLVAPDQLLVVTHLGQVLVFDAHRGSVVGSLDLVDGVDPKDSNRGLDDCQPARARCPIAAAPAFSEQTGIIVTSLWEPGAERPELVGLRYRQGQAPLLSREWTSADVGGGPIGSPVVSGDGQTVYVNGRDGHLWALSAGDGKKKWSVDLGFTPQTPPSVADDGTIVAGGGPGAKLVGIKGADDGSSGKVVWTRDDVAPLTTSSRAGNDVAYTVVRDGEKGMALLTFDPADGHTLNSYPLPNADGYPVGVSVSHDRRVVAATSDGRVYGFAPA
jgi:outer membrane protein assembly factor BamB